MSWSWARRGTSLPRPGLGPRAGLQSPGERRVGKMYQRVCLLGPRFPEQLSPVSTMLSHLPRVSREGNYFAHILNWRILVPGPHNEELGAPVANPAERKGGTEMREKITGTLGAIWCCCRPKSRNGTNIHKFHYEPVSTLTDFSKITGFIERHVNRSWVPRNLCRFLQLLSSLSFCNQHVCLNPSAVVMMAL
ncbi:uncharacterized protein LOC117199207 isoform X1 [Orcinus orca]|uniref:uncharacterized protein LOC117199207 isoform X1 n=1 Tax=Orcinus orca TaxID=9733 RepID=UPI00211150EB|nr:uncharacterized protein LOC117199207 isoform X1 [Orcinus orca]